MRSIKPGRGPSAMGAAGSVIAIVFGIFWTILAFSITKNAPFPMVSTIFPLFGVLFIIVGIVQAVIHFKNATGRNRMSLFDIVDADEEPDPIARGRGPRNASGAIQGTDSEQTAGYCPYCGMALRSDYAYCPKCGKSLERPQ